MASLVFCLFSPFKVLNRVLIWLINKMLLVRMLPLSLKIPISSQISKKRFPKKDAIKETIMVRVPSTQLLITY